MPRLTRFGIGIGDWKRNADGSWETFQQHRERFVQCRQELRGKNATEEFLRALAFIQRVKPITRINSSSGSYKLKHIAEDYRSQYPNGEKLGPYYVSNGALIAAAFHAGFTVREYPGDLNTCFNMSKRSIDDLDCEIRPHIIGNKQKRA